MKLATLLAIALPLTCQAAEVMTMRPLFNATNLDGWTGDGYVVEGGAIVCTPAGRNLVTKATYANFVLDYQCKLEPAANSGIGIHYPGTGDAACTGMEIQILDPGSPDLQKLKPWQLHGSLYTLAPARQGALKPTGEWNQHRITVMGPTLKVELNGEIILRANFDDLAQKNPDHQGVKRRSGHIALLGHGKGVSFRKIHIAELPPVANEAGVKAAGFTKIFDGKSLAGWKHEADTSNWKPVLGILKHNGQKGPVNDLWSTKTYQDFTLVFDWRWSARGPKMQRPVVQPDGSQKGQQQIEEFDSGIYLRGSTKSQVNLWNWNVGSGEVYGYRTDGSMSADVRAGVTPKKNADRPVGEWNRTLITVKGDRLTVQINGTEVISSARLPGMPESGPIGLQHHGSAIDFANLWIRED